MSETIAKMLSFTGIIDSTPKHDLKKLEEEYKASVKRLDLGTVKLDDFELMATLGRGTFGRVRLTRHKLLEQRALALKIMKKSEIIRLKQTGKFVEADPPMCDYVRASAPCMCVCVCVCVRALYTCVSFGFTD